jgi:hypothetical protein
MFFVEMSTKTFYSSDDKSSHLKKNTNNTFLSLLNEYSNYRVWLLGSKFS